MPHYSQEDIDKAKGMDLLTYLQNYEPEELVHVSGDTYCTREHDSLKISNGKWCWFSRGIGGVSALDYLQKVKGLSFLEVMEILYGNSPEALPVPKTKTETVKELILPPPYKDTKMVETYLRKRCISQEIIQYCIDHGMLYESVVHHNAVFVGLDKEGNPKYACQRGTSTNFKQDVKGSDKHYSFFLSENPAPTELHVFEAVIDLLSLATMEKEWKQRTYLSLGGIYKPKGDGMLPMALERVLSEYPTIRTVHLHLDSDLPGRLASEGIMEALPSKYHVLDEPPEYGKDYNDYLKIRNRKTTLENNDRKNRQVCSLEGRILTYRLTPHQNDILRIAFPECEVTDVSREFTDLLAIPAAVVVMNLGSMNEEEIKSFGDVFQYDNDTEICCIGNCPDVPPSHLNFLHRVERHPEDMSDTIDVVMERLQYPLEVER